MLVRMIMFLGLGLMLFASPAQAQNSSAGMTPCGNGLSLSVTGTTSNVLLSACGTTAVIWNTGSVEAFFNWGTASNTAAVAATSWSLPPGSSVTLSTGRAPLYLAAITSSSTTTLRIVQGQGAPAISGPGFASGGASQAVTFNALAPVAPATATATQSVLGGCQATSAAINPTTGQQAAVDCDLNNNLLVSSGGAPNLTTAQVTVTTASTSVVAARALRRNVTITNVTGTQQVYCSGTTATTANGQLIPAVVGASWNVSTTAAINCIAVSSSQTVSTSETF